MNNLNELKKNLIDEINMRQENKVIEKNNADLLIKLITNAEDETEANMIAQLGTMYKKTGFHYDVRLEKKSDTIKYLKKNEKLSFCQDGIKHKLIIGDNYDALRQLSISHKNTVDVIYIDPPYGCNDMGEFAKTNYDNQITRDNLLSMLDPRLRLAKELLKDTGVIFVSIDDKNYAYVKMLMDDIFKECNFVGTLVWQSATDNNPTQISTEHEYIICYAIHSVILDKWVANSDTAILIRDKYNEIKASGITDPKMIQKELRSWINKNKKSLPSVSHYNNVDEIGVYSNSQNSSNTKPGGYTYDIIHPVTKKPVVKPAYGWRWKEETFWNAANSGNVEWGKDETTQPHMKKRIETVTDQLKSIYYEDGRNATTLLEGILGDKTLFKNPKPINLIKKIIRFACPEDGVVLDFFAGSGTTGQAVLSMNEEDGENRQFILCTNNEKTDVNPNGIAYDVTTKKLKRIMTGECYDGTKDFKWIENNTPYGGSLDVYEIDSISSRELEKGKTPFDVIDECAYGIEKISKSEEKVKWVCENFENTQLYIEEEE